MSFNSTMPLIRPPSDGSQGRRGAFVQANAAAGSVGAGGAGAALGLGTGAFAGAGGGVSPFASVMAQESQSRSAKPTGGMPPSSMPGFKAGAGPFSAVMAATAETPSTVVPVSKGGMQGRMPGDRAAPPMLGREIGMSGGHTVQGQATTNILGMPGMPAAGGGKDRAIPPMVNGLGQSAMPEINRNSLARANIVAQVTMDKQRTQALENMSKSMGGDSPLDMARNSVTMRNLRTVVGGFSLRAPVMPMADSIKSQALQGAGGAGRTGGVGRAGKSHKPVEDVEIGKLAAQFESGRDGVAAIGYDRVGGTSYGKYQIASRVGSMDGFLKFLDTAAPDMSKELRAAGPANTGSRKGAMPDTWRKLAAEQPERFEALQEKFIYDSHYKPALEAVAARTPLDEDRISSVMQEVLWSTAVQHGPAGAARIFSRAAEGAGNATDKNYDKKLINNVYAIRAEQFGSSTEQVQESVRNRMHREKKLALNMLAEQGNKVA